MTKTDIDKYQDFLNRDSDDNLSFQPTGDGVLVMPLLKKSIIIKPDGVSPVLDTPYAVVLEVGPGKNTLTGERVKPEVSVGDKVLLEVTNMPVTPLKLASGVAFIVPSHVIKAIVREKSDTIDAKA